MFCYAMTIHSQLVLHALQCGIVDERMVHKILAHLWRANFL